ncbi:MAG TPA: 3-oxoacyl-[acyl-carrier-protein] synthase III C-terminal domain-containing protein [Kofleriaceae bacterium]
MGSLRCGSKAATAREGMRLAEFVATRPPFEIDQQRSLAWLAAAHAEAEATVAKLDDRERNRFETKVARVLGRCAPQPSKLARRGHSVADVERAGFAANELYDLTRHAHGRTTAVRMKMFADRVTDYFARTYEAEQQPPDDLIHVTCTGYVSPSGAQRLVAAKGWGSHTRVTHAYHMGCYAALPAVRIAAGFSAIGARRVDIAHTELCSLHLDPSDHRVEQLVVQSLFADGLIRYSMLPDAGPGLRLVTAYEVVLPDSESSMGWRISDHGMQMTLARDVPDRIASALRGFVLELFKRGGLQLGHLKTSVFAVHPGGPKIIDRVRDVLELDDGQVAASRGVLHDYGNMSSATLPHIWMRLLADPNVPRGTLIPSLAFGPGLTVCGALLEKQ